MADYMSSELMSMLMNRYPTNVEQMQQSHVNGQSTITVARTERPQANNFSDCRFASLQPIINITPMAAYRQPRTMCQSFQGNRGMIFKKVSATSTQHCRYNGQYSATNHPTPFIPRLYHGNGNGRNVYHQPREEIRFARGSFDLPRVPQNSLPIPNYNQNMQYDEVHCGRCGTVVRTTFRSFDSTEHRLCQACGSYSRIKTAQSVRAVYQNVPYGISPRREFFQQQQQVVHPRSPPNSETNSTGENAVSSSVDSPKTGSTTGTSIFSEDSYLGNFLGPRGDLILTEEDFL